MPYLWLKAFHIIFMVAWFAGLFYIFRLFVYHARFKDNKDMTAAYVLMERKLLTVIMHPAMFLTMVFGFFLVTQNQAVFGAGWFWAKMGFVFALIGYHLFATVTHRRFSEGDIFLSEKACRLINEIPTLILIGIVILAVVKPL
jgi:protoporphyrinogen IX oxidase